MPPLPRPAVPAPSALDADCASLIRKAGGTCKRVVRVLPPRDSGGEAEVLYLDADGTPATAYIQDSAGSPTLLAVGW